jgi:hypothetical protein
MLLLGQRGRQSRDHKPRSRARARQGEKNSSTGARDFTSVPHGPVPTVVWGVEPTGPPTTVVGLELPPTRMMIVAAIASIVSSTAVVKPTASRVDPLAAAGTADGEVAGQPCGGHGGHGGGGTGDGTEGAW